MPSVRFIPDSLLASAAAYHVPGTPPGKSCQAFQAPALPSVAVVAVHVSASSPALTVIVTGLWNRGLPDVGDVAIDVEALLAERRARVAADGRHRRRVVEADACGVAARDRDRRRLRCESDARSTATPTEERNR
jgi:hypothetical protein